MKIIASLVLFKHSYDDVKNTLFSLINESSIDKIAIVDNGNYCQWLKSFSHPKVETIHLVKNEGFGAGHNAVFKKYLNKFSHFLVCNPDIVFELGEVDKLFAFSINNNVGLAMPKVIYPDGSLQYGSKLLPTPFQLFIRRFFPAYSTSMNDSYELRLADYTKSFLHHLYLVVLCSLVMKLFAILMDLIRDFSFTLKTLICLDEFVFQIFP